MNFIINTESIKFVNIDPNSFKKTNDNNTPSFPLSKRRGASMVS